MIHIWLDPIGAGTDKRTAAKNRTNIMGLIMRQVPTFLIIGNGRVARHMCHYFTSLDIPYTQWHRQLPVSALAPLVAAASHILLLIRDDAIERFAQTHLAESDAVKIHFSGALNARGIYGAHPLMTFGADLYAAEKYRDIYFIIDSNAPDFADLLPGLPNAHARLDTAQKAKYHALCVMAGNFSCLLWQKLFDTLQSDFDIPATAAAPYLKQQTENLLADYQTALTGPLARGDTATIARNMAALKDDEFQAVYHAFVEAYKGKQEKAS
jgi:predicted short-subunit dehydrogenase-like oxidoreductase (DUF2520 family)